MRILEGDFIDQAESQMSIFPLAASSRKRVAKTEKTNYENRDLLSQENIRQQNTFFSI